MKLRENQIRLLGVIKAEMDKLILHKRILDAEMFITGIYHSVALMDEKEASKLVSQAQEDEWWGDIKPNQDFEKAPLQKTSEEYTPLLPLLGRKPPVFNLDTMREFADNVELVLKST